MTTSQKKKIADKTCGFASIYDLKLLREPKNTCISWRYDYNSCGNSLDTMFSCVKHTLWIMMEDDNLLLQ